MTGNEHSPESAAPPKPIAENASPAATIRLAVLLALLAVAIGIVLVDTYQFKPAVEATGEKLTQAIDDRNKLSIEAAGKQPFTSPEEVQKIIGFQPTRKETVGKHLIEYYCWWGNLPIKRRFIAVAYDKRKDGNWIHIKHDIDVNMTEAELPLSEEKAMEMAKKAIREAGNGPERQMKAPDLSAPPGTSEPPAEKTEPTTEPAPTEPVKETEKEAPKESETKTETEQPSEK